MVQSVSLILLSFGESNYRLQNYGRGYGPGEFGDGAPPGVAPGGYGAQAPPYGRVRLVFL